MTESFIILGTSSKNGGLCVAGVRPDGTWIRIVSGDAATNGAIPHNFMDGCGVLDYVSVDIVKKQPTKRQPENCLVNLSVPIQYHEKVSLQKVLEIHALDNPQYIFGDTGRAIPESIAEKQTTSLLLIEVQNLHLYKNEYNKSRADFFYNGELYQEISVTDPECYQLNDNHYARAHLVMSLADQSWFNNSCELYYKFVAKVFFERVNYPLNFNLF